MKTLFLLFTSLLATTFAGGDFYVMPVESKVYVYQTDVSDVVISSLKKDGRAKVVSSTKKRYQVQVNDSLTGWVSKRDVAKLNSKDLKFGDESVVGTDAYKAFEPIFGDDQAPITYEPAERDFKNALKQNIDKEAQGRQ